MTQPDPPMPPPVPRRVLEALRSVVAAMEEVYRLQQKLRRDEP